MANDEWITYVPQNHAAGWFENAQEAFEKAHGLEAFATEPFLLNPQDVLAEAKRILDIAVALENKI